MEKPLIYLDSDLAILCLARSLRTAGFCAQADQLHGVTVSNVTSARYAHRLITALPPAAPIEEERRGALEMLSFAVRGSTMATPVQAPIEL
jgi:hypothetical protein